MLKTILFSIIGCFAVSCGISYQMTGKSLRKFRSAFIETENFGIRKKPITNREYILFIAWNMSVYGESFPEYVMDLLPQSCIDRADYAHSGFLKLLGNSTSILKDYILNAKYIDYPVTGLSRSQVNELEKWLSDRYNENMLMVEGIMNFNFQQKDEDCFVLEPYLLGQYQGSVRMDKVINWKDGKYLPVFRLPDQHEVLFAQNNLKLGEPMREYKFTSKDFLWLWNKYLLKVDKSKNEITIDCKCTTLSISDMEYYGLSGTIRKVAKPFEVVEQQYGDRKQDHNEPIVIVGQQAALPLNGNLPIDTLKTGRDEIGKTEYLDEVSFGEKNKYGKMDFVIIGGTSLDRPVVAEAPIFNAGDSPIEKIYWIAFDNRIDSRYWPKKD